MSLELDDIQALVVRGYGDHPVSACVMLSVRDAQQARAWIARRLDAFYTAGHRLHAKRAHAMADATLVRSEPPLRAASERPRAMAAEKAAEPAPLGLRLNVAFCHGGLAALGYPEPALTRFPGPFQLGITRPAHRSRILGDTGRSAPEHWRFSDLDHHVLLLCFAQDEAQLRLGLAALEQELSEGFAIAHVIPTHLPPDGREHFGFRDGISQPYLQGTDLSGLSASAIGPASVLKPGEFVLGYDNEFAHLPHTPTVPPETDAHDALPPATRFAPGGAVLAMPGRARRDFGRNGSFIVLRQLEQHVETFHAYSQAHANGVPEQAARLEAKMVGRWHDGSPLALCPHNPEPQHAAENRFTYAEDDLFGVHCPVGSHVRRGFPRDAKVDNESGVDAQRALQLTRQHRLIRRGRLYSDPATGERGLMFLCLQSNIERQFEFVQHTWCNSEKFAGLYDERDPIIGTQPEEASSEGSTGQGWRGHGHFTIPEPLLRRRLLDLPNFVTVRGGGYYFMPSIRALRYLAHLNRPVPSTSTDD